MTKYIRNENGGVHSVDDTTVVDHKKDGTPITFFDKLHETTPSGNRVLPAGWSVLTEKQAREAHPQLFGARDATVRLNAKELADQKALAEFQDPALYETQE